MLDALALTEDLRDVMAVIDTERIQNTGCVPIFSRW